MRVSNEDQQSDNQSLALKQEIARRNLKVVREYRLDGFSAWKGEHAGRLESMLQDAEAGQFANLMVWALDRLSRQGELDLLKILDRLERAGVKIISIQEPWTESPSEFRGILASFAGYHARMESSRRSERIKISLKRAVLNDQWPHGQPPYGYRRGADGPLAVDETEAQVVRTVFDLADTGRIGAREIQKRLLGVATTRRGGAVWSVSVLDRMLRDPSYIGIHRTGISAPPIISREQFDRVQARLISNRSLKPRTANYWPLQGRMRCHCGQSWTFDQAKPGRVFLPGPKPCIQTSAAWRRTLHNSRPARKADH